MEVLGLLVQVSLSQTLGICAKQRGNHRYLWRFFWIGGTETVENGRLVGCGTRTRPAFGTYGVCPLCDHRLPLYLSAAGSADGTLDGPCDRCCKPSVDPLHCKKEPDPLNMAEETHPLQHEWVLWEHKSAEKKDPSKWKENMKQLCAFSTLEDFWGYFNHLPRPSEVFFDGDCRKNIGPDDRTVEEYSLFKKGIEPEWGDPQNIIGGEWFCRQYFEPDVLDLYWQNLVMGIVGETIEDGVDEEKTYEDHINGARVVDKSRNFPMYKLEVWINTRDPVIKERLRNRLVEVLTDGQPPSRKMHPKFDWKDHIA